ncbi:hypothetical protein NPIL_176211 [Nephila pilipes]|uniref:Uncharacterized protein n=1 Tax=Nephila pilipes TaxID=299642 RepID=A0A8X6N4X5_NEPPI|nr:hypothetical protein NPIL_176211 [Nephila pilipes]
MESQNLCVSEISAPTENKRERAKRSSFSQNLLSCDILQAVELLQNLAELLNKFPAPLDILVNKNNNNSKKKRNKKFAFLEALLDNDSDY